jgi:hypothetical protein
MTIANAGVTLAATKAITANAIFVEIDFFRTILIRLKRLLRERPTRDVRKTDIFHFVGA